MLIGDAVGAEAVASALTTAVTPQALWGGIVPFAAFIGVMIVFAFSYKFFRRQVKRAGGGKA